MQWVVGILTFGCYPHSPGIFDQGFVSFLLNVGFFKVDVLCLLLMCILSLIFGLFHLGSISQ